MSGQATIQQILEVNPVENADSLDVVSVLGWKVVTKKDEFKVGDLCIYVEVDSKVPEDNEEFKFLERYHYRVKTIKLRGQISQGLVLPINLYTGSLSSDQIIGTDVSDVLKITHYEKPLSVQMMGMARGNFPTKLCPKTDEKMIQSHPRVLEELEGSEYFMTIKCNGTSGTFLSSDNMTGINTPELLDLGFNYQICSRNISFKWWVMNDENIYVRMSNKYNLKEKLNEIGNIAIQGEICGPGIQKNQMELKDIRLFVFNVYDIKNQRYYNYDEQLYLCHNLGLETVPFIERGIFTKDMTIDWLLKKTDTLYPGTKNPQEGIVIRPTIEMHSKSLQGRLSFKVLNNVHLLKEKG